MLSSEHKTEILIVGAIKPIKDAVVMIAQDEKMSVSEWLRSPIVGGLRGRGQLQALSRSAGR
jgi:hypothetical protein